MEGVEQTEPDSKSDPKERRSRQSNTSREALNIIFVLLSAFVVAFVLISFVFQVFLVSGESMQQTLHNHDRLLVWKVPRTWARITRHAYVPDRGDIIVFNEPEATVACNSDGGTQLVKRVIGLPGDRVVVAHGRFTVYNKQHPNGFDPDKTLPYRNQITEVTDYDVDVRLGPNQIFVSGDNRTGSCDSRIFGPINLNQVVGKLELRLLPVSHIKAF